MLHPCYGGYYRANFRKLQVVFQKAYEPQGLALIIEQPIVAGRLVRRYKRFLADIRLADGALITAHCPNSGAMTGCASVGSPVYVTVHSNPKRKLKYTWETVEIDDAVICVNTHRPNGVVDEALRLGTLPFKADGDVINREVVYGREKARLDFCLEGKDRRFYLEVKSVTLPDGPRKAAFPDAQTTRGHKHLRALMEAVDCGHRAGLVYCVSRTDTQEMKIAEDIDPKYAKLARMAKKAGVEFYAFGMKIELPHLSIDREVHLTF